MSRHRERYNDVPDVDFELIPEGRYQVKVIESVVVEKPGKNDQWKLTLEITRGQFKGRLLWATYSMIDKAKGFRKGAITAMGLDPEGEVDLIDDVQGRRCYAEVNHEDYEGKTYSRVKRLRSIGEAEKERQSVEDKVKEETDPANQDDIPF
jgi:hypothetical protein